MKRSRGAAEAHAFLDRVRDGTVAADERAISHALQETGDLAWSDPIRPHRPVGSWERGGGGLLLPATWVDSLS